MTNLITEVRQLARYDRSSNNMAFISRYIEQ